ncbi:hypothetical protein [Tautonia plasticadhaerens]|uniref:Uncharacterized protein n=1 Tax=Tautonia plasticadhaerens TaxID=2527974 RepID=A0A518H290_9BACT|nr:hypothetical protein [Tautonia plasticadhaerens]QDV34959.1 hypothetical protein ElP_28560 [Tautonia plasticadhaerens]
MTTPGHDRTQRRVVCAACKIGDTIIAGARHFDMVMHGQLARMPEFNVVSGYTKAVHKAEQGFIDQRGVFMNRREAFEVATAAGQIRHKSGNPDSKELFSEDLY